MDALKQEIAALAAQMIADSGLDYFGAKQKAARQLLGERGARRQSLPDNELVDRFLLEHLQLMDPDHPQRVQAQRVSAALLMENLRDFDPYLTGGAWKGICAAHAPIHLQLFTDLAKELEMHLLDQGIAFDVEEIGHFGGQGQVPVLILDWQGWPTMLSVYESRDLRGALRRQETPEGERALRGNLAAVLKLPPVDALVGSAAALTGDYDTQPDFPAH